MIPPLFAILSFPVAVATLFARFTVTKALILSLILGYLFLPHGQGLDLPLLPSINKDVMPALAAFLALTMVNKKRLQGAHMLPGWIPRSILVITLLGLLVVSAAGTVLTNSEPLVFTLRTIPGLKSYDIGSILAALGLTLLPLLLARRYLGHPDTHTLLLTVLVGSALFYSLLALFEVRMSPQINITVYGYFQHVWSQHVRGGGFRPIVFLQHGLWVSLFLGMSILAACALVRDLEASQRSKYLLAAAWLLGTLVLTKSLGALIIALLFAPIILLLNPRLQLTIALVVATIAVTYPLLRGAGYIPIQWISDTAHSIDPDRAASLSTRLFNEDLLLERAQQKPLFGWGTWGRNLIYNHEGFTQTITDGYWIIIISQWGWLGYIGIFGLLSSSLLGLVRHARSYAISPATAGLAILLAANMIDMIPNATETPLTWILAGALLGRQEHGRIEEDIESDVDDLAQAGPRGMNYSRFPTRPRATRTRNPARKSTSSPTTGSETPFQSHILSEIDNA